MSSLGSPSPFFLTGKKKAYQVERSLRINRSDNPQLYRTGSNNASTYTVSMWIKISGSFSNYRRLFSSYADGLILNNDSRLRYEDEGDGQAYSTAVFRDPTAWYHIVMAVNPSGGTVYVNNETHITSSMTHSLSTSSNAIRHFWNPGDPGQFAFDGYGAEVALIDGQALTPSSFAETDAITGQWIPKDLSGLTFGSNGHYLKFTDSTNLGKDFSGNNNNFTVANFSVATGAGNDSVEDTPTNNFCTMNPIDRDSSVTASDGNLKVSNNNQSWAGLKGTFAVSSGKWYYEMKCSDANLFCGWASDDLDTFLGSPQDDNSAMSKGVLIFCDNGKYQLDTGGSGTRINYSSALSANDVLGCAIDLDNNTAQFYKNGTGQGSINISSSKLATKQVHPYFISYYTAQNYTFNFGQQAFAYTPPTGFKALCSANLPDPSIKLPDKHFDTLLYTGNGGSNSITGLQFQPDWLWIKNRGQADNHQLHDAVRGASKGLHSNLTNAEFTDADAVTSFDSNGFSMDNNYDSHNKSSETYVAWNWNAGGSTASNSDGSITSSVRANTTAGFSIVNFTPTAASTAVTTGHGLGVAPDVVIVKSRGSSANWDLLHMSLGSSYKLYLNGTNAKISSGAWGNTDPTSSVFTYNPGSQNNNAHIAYCFSEVAGYSKFGSYVGNGSTDGTFVFTGFRPAVIIFKNASTATNWEIYDTKRQPNNPTLRNLYPNSTSSEEPSSVVEIDIVSNGFKIKTYWSEINNNNDTHIFIAFAESPFKYSRAR